MEYDALPRVQVFLTGVGDVPTWLGHGTAFAPRAVVLHPRAAALAAAAMSRPGDATEGGVRVRCRIDSPGTPVIDGRLDPSAQRAWRHLVVVGLDLSIDGVEFDDEVGPGSALQHDAYADALEALARRREATDPPAPEAPPPDPHGGSPSLDEPGISPPWCWLFPHAPGCG